MCDSWSNMSRAVPRAIVCAALLALACFGVRAGAVPMNANQAAKVVKGWLKANPQPLQTNLGGQIDCVQTFAGADGEPIYYIVNLLPQGFAIVSADDLVEPVIGFSAGETYEASQDSPLVTLISRDLPSRLAVVRRNQKASRLGEKNLTPSAKALQKACAKAKDKWARLGRDGESAKKGGASGSFTDPGEIEFTASRISEVRAGPLVRSRWHQTTACNTNLYNYYTPENFPCGCVATAMSQLIRYHEYPTVGVGEGCSTVWVESDKETICLRGGDGNGGPYDWGLMEFVPGCNTTDQQRRAIGALCSDAGVATDTNYYEAGSAADMDAAADALKRTFRYRNVIYGSNRGNEVGSALRTMINPNLDGGYPTLLAIYSNQERGHAVICDGYGYDSSTLYHHINMGWAGHNDAWYNLPEIADYDIVIACLYNIFPSFMGEIISGRITDQAGDPISEVTVTAGSDNAVDSDASTNNKGIYALTLIRSNTPYTVSAQKKGYRFKSSSVTTRRSQDFQAMSGNVWALDFAGVAAAEADFNRDGIVNLIDFSILVKGWLE